MPKFLGYFERVLQKNGGPYLIGGRLTYVDLSIFQNIEGLRYAFPKHMKRFERKIPGLVALHDRVAQRPRIKAYLASRQDPAHPVQPVGRLPLFWTRIGGLAMDFTIPPRIIRVEVRTAQRLPTAMRTAFNVAARRRSPMGAPQSGQVPSVLLMNTLPGTLRLTLYPPEFLEPRRRQLGIAPRVPDVLVA